MGFIVCKEVSLVNLRGLLPEKKLAENISGILQHILVWFVTAYPVIHGSFNSSALTCAIVNSIRKCQNS
jgi:hypothetical protein